LEVQQLNAIRQTCVLLMAGVVTQVWSLITTSSLLSFVVTSAYSRRGTWRVVC